MDVSNCSIRNHRYSVLRISEGSTMIDAARSISRRRGKLAVQRAGGAAISLTSTPILERRIVNHWGDFGGTPHGKDGEIRVRMGKFTKQSWPTRDAATYAFSKTCVGNKGVSLAPQVGFEPTTLRLTAECSTVELLRSKCVSFH